MELIKKDDRWDLYNEDGHKIASTLDGCLNKLSTKNCQAIERGYDLDELIKNDYIKYSVKDDKLSLDEQIQRSGGFNVGYKEGFQKALELMDDKKFSEDDMKRAFNKGAFYGSTGLGNTHYFDGILKSLQQTEWDVEIVEEDDKDVLVDDIKEFLSELGDNPKLDTDGNLILKRK